MFHCPANITPYDTGFAMDYSLDIVFIQPKSMTMFHFVLSIMDKYSPGGSLEIRVSWRECVQSDNLYIPMRQIYKSRPTLDASFCHLSLVISYHFLHPHANTPAWLPF